MARVADDGWLSADDAAQFLGIGVRTLYRFIDQGELPAYRIGRVIRLREQDVLAYIDASRIKPGELANLYPPPRLPTGRVSSRGGPKPNPERDAAIVGAYKNGGTIDRIAAELRVGTHTVIRALDAPGIDRKRGQRRDLG